MISHYDWPGNILLVMATARGGNQYGYLLDHVTQERFMENWVDNIGRDIVNMSIQQLSEESMEILLPFYRAVNRYLEGD